ncbi:toprim-like family protein, partial [Helicobacter pylori]
LNVILAMDNDEQERKFNAILEKIFYAHTKEIPSIYTPISKDANDDLKIAKALGLKQISNRILQDFLFDAKEKMQNPITTPSQKSILANQLQKLQDLMPKPKLLQGVFHGYQQDHGFGSKYVANSAYYTNNQSQNKGHER